MGVLKFGDSGPEVRRWQQVLIVHGYAIASGATGSFREQTHNATMAFQSATGLPRTGVVGDAEWAAASNNQINRVFVPGPVTLPSPIPYVECKRWTRGVTRAHINLWVIHCMEAPEASTTAKNCSHYLANLSDNEKPRSAHYFIDDAEVIQGVHDDCVAWHAPGANQDGIGVEHAGFARQSPSEWLDDFGVKMLAISAELCAVKIVRYGWPIKFVTAAELVAGRSSGASARGITTHAEVTAAFHKSDHTDPGTNFPMDWYLDRVKAAVARLQPNA